MNRLILFFLFNILLILPPVYAADKGYAVSAIPAELSNSAKVIYRDYTAEYSIKSAGKAELKVTYAVTLLDGADKSAAYFIQYYHGELNKIKNCSGSIYNKEGKRVKKNKTRRLFRYQDYGIEQCC
ncbi:MAG: hypothetical protein KL787_00180 [Taibaiella sp.]|nr:hypothetical protein [Taibaiella sp.]